MFAWGACFYELLCGRIPYEGPDTKTTNSYVVKGDAAPPTAPRRVDPGAARRTSTMKALEPSTERRFKDASEAEEALREAWDRCLRDGLVTPMALAGEEIAHERAGKTMHAAVTSQTKDDRIAPSVATTSSSSAEGLRTEDLLVGDETDPGQVTARRDGGAVLVVQPMGKGRVGDDDPTRVVHREDRRDVPAKAGKSNSSSSRTPASKPRDDEATTQKSREVAIRPQAPSKAPWIFVMVLVASIAAVITAYLLDASRRQQGDDVLGAAAGQGVAGAAVAVGVDDAGVVGVALDPHGGTVGAQRGALRGSRRRGRGRARPRDRAGGPRRRRRV